MFDLTSHIVSDYLMLYSKFLHYLYQFYIIYN